MSWNGGCSCGCNGNGITVLCKMQSGDTFPVHLQYNDDDVVASIEEGWDIVIAFYDYKGDRILKGSTADGRIALCDDNYIINISHEESVQMVGSVGVELTLTNDNGEVYHGDKIVYVDFEPRQNNEIVL